MTWTIVEDIPPVIGFALAMIALLAIPVNPGGGFNRAAKGFFAAAIMCYVISTSASILGRVGYFPDYLEPAIVSVELLWVPFMVFGVYALYAHQQVTDAISSQHAVKQAGEMLESVMETAPAGIMVLNDAGSITFANGEARRLLDIIDDSASALGSSDWSISRVRDHEDDGLVCRDFRAILGPEPLVAEPLLVAWPNGWHRHLLVNTAPFEDGSGRIGGAVASFLERDAVTQKTAR